MTLPDFDRLAELLAQAPPLELAILPERAFVLVAQLHPGWERQSAVALWNQEEGKHHG